MKAKSYRSFSNLFTRRLNTLFGSNGMLKRWNMMCVVNDGSQGMFDRFRSTVEEFGNEKQLKAYDELLSLMKDNPRFNARMHSENS